ncbi:MAG: twin-arginine translocation signal domain-containing protein [Lentisphaeraceae bacterium]|nr:twin-arginine translocation signal domain-containing protein [Lentisphaeraceae bacterium]
MDSRRDFLKMASKAVPAGVAGAFLATGCKSASCDVEEVANITGSLPGNIVFTKSNEGIWEGKSGSHVASLVLEGGKGSLVTKHGMSPAHYIVRHSIVTPEGEMVFANTFKYDDKKAVSELDLSALKKGQKYFALSYCNKHDLWLSEISI